MKISSIRKTQDKNFKFQILALSILILFCFALFSYFVHKDLFTQFDFDTTVRIQDKISGRFDTFFSVFSLLGSTELVTLFLIVLIIILRKLKRTLIFVPYFMSFVIELYGKIFVVHPGPPYMFFRYDIPFNFPSSYVKPGSSFPSGHSTRTLFISMILLFLIGKSKRLSSLQKTMLFSLVFLFDIIMLVSRVYLGEHWSSDVIGGGLLGGSLGILSLVFF